MEFNSLDAQRESCEAYIVSQKAEGWMLIQDRFDDGGVSGGTLERPALKRLVAAIEAGKVDVVVVYKIDRLSRSLMDFARLVDVFDRKQVTFVSVTQSFNTTTSMGRLTLNVLLSFAQFEREVIGERIRDKVAASRKKGIWMGGWAPLGYLVKNRKLVVDEIEAELVRSIFVRFAQYRSGLRLVQELEQQGVRNRYGKVLTKTSLYKLLHNRVYLGEAVHKGVSYAGEHDAIVPKALWDKAHAVMAEKPKRRGAHTRAKVPALLKGLIFGSDGLPMTPTHTKRRGRQYRYYVGAQVLKNGTAPRSPTRIAAGEIERLVVDQIAALARTPQVIVSTWKAARQQIDGVSERQVRDALLRFDEIWNELFPAEQGRLVELLVARIDLCEQGAKVSIKADGLASLIGDLLSRAKEAA